MSGPVIYRVENAIAHIILNRPEKLNALSDSVIERVVEALRVSEDDPEVKVVILSGAGSSFCSGGDLDTMRALDSAKKTSQWIELASSLTKTIVDLDKYVVSAVQGYAAGAGFSLALSSDFVVADQHAKFALNFTKLGLIPDLGLTKHLVEHVPLSIAKEWVSSAKIVTAEEAFKWGIVNRIAKQNVLDEAIEFSQFIINGPALSNKYVKHLLNRSRSSNLDVALMNENMVQTMLLQTEDHQEGILAHLEKRNPIFTEI